MPPKQVKSSTGAAPKHDDGQSTEPLKKEEEDTGKDNQEKPSSKKRKQSAKAVAEPKKAARRSGRNVPKISASPEAVLKYLLSDAALEHCQPSVENETKNESAKADKSALRLYTTHATKLSPFEELLSAAILSRPISHRLGHRTIRTVLNEPYNFTSAKVVHKAGRDAVSQAIWDAKTQHKEKTAQEIWDIASTVLENYKDGDTDGTSLQGLRKKANNDAEKERSELQQIKGIGKTGLDIFFRRIQWLWDEAYPFIDDRTSDALKALGLPSAADELVNFLKEHGHDGDDRRKTFVIVLERAVGSSLEGAADTVLQQA